MSDGGGREGLAYPACLLLDCLRDNFLRRAATCGRAAVFGQRGWDSDTKFRTSGLSRWIFLFAAISIVAGSRSSIDYYSLDVVRLLRCACARVDRNGRRTRSTYARVERIEGSFFFPLFFPFLFTVPVMLTSCINGR